MRRYSIGRIGGRTVHVSRRHQGRSASSREVTGTGDDYQMGDAITGNLAIDILVYLLVLTALLWPIYFLWHQPTDPSIIAASFLGPLGLAFGVVLVYGLNERQSEIDAAREARLAELAAIPRLPVPGDDAITLSDFLAGAPAPGGTVMCARLWVDGRFLETGDWQELYIRGATAYAAHHQRITFTSDRSVVEI